METIRRTLKPLDNKSTPMAQLAFELLNGVTKVHLNHLLVSGPGSFAAHKAMNSFYDEIGDLSDLLVEQYQGLTETLLVFPTSCELPIMKTADDCLNYLRRIYDMVNTVQKTCQYSEISNNLDEIKTLINSTKYKLIFLK